MSLAFIPLYIKFLGIEAYGIIGIFTSLVAIFSLFDMGMGATLNRETARLSAQPDGAQRIRDLARTLELIYWLLAGLIAVVVFFMAPLISGFWIKPQALSVVTITDAFAFMGLAIAFQFPFSLYAGGMAGLQKHVSLNLLTATMATLRFGGAAMVLWLVEPTILAFFSWQILVGALQSFMAAMLLWRRLPKSECAARFNGALLRQVWRFAAGVTGISILGVVLAQMDKIVLSKLLTLEMFGYYSLASVVASGLYVIISPVFTAIFPRFSQLIAHRDEEDVKQLYHQSAQLLSVLLLPIAWVLAAFSREILLLWTADPIVADKAHALVSLLVIGTAINGLIHVPYALQLGYGWTRFGLYQNLVSILLLPPLLIVMTKWYGPEGAAITWIALNVGYLLIGQQIMHSRFLRGEKWRWYISDVFSPFMGVFLMASAISWWDSWDVREHIKGSLIWMLVLYGLLLLTAVLFAPHIRKQLSGIMKYLIGKPHAS